MLPLLQHGAVFMLTRKFHHLHARNLTLNLTLYRPQVIVYRFIISDRQTKWTTNRYGRQYKKWDEPHGRSHNMINLK